MPNPTAIVQPATIRSLPQEFDPEQFRAMLQSHPAAERLRWWRATLDPAYTGPNTGGNQTKWLREEQTNAREFLALVQGAQVLHRYLPQGALQSGDLVVTTMPDELPLAEEDWIVPIGRLNFGVDTGITSLPDARTFVYRQLLTRGGVEIAGAGTITSSGNAVTGTGTAFTSLFQVGDILRAAGQSFRVTTVSSNTQLTMDGSPSPAWSGNAYVKAVERLLQTPAAWIEEIRDSTKTYVPETDYALASDEATVQWKSAANSPAPGTRYSIRYRHLPRYVVLGDMGLQRHVVRGVRMPQRVIARFWNPESFRS